MFDIESIQAMFDGNAVKFTQHFKARIKERGIKFADVKQALLSGEIIEQCPDDQPLPSIIIFGHTNDNAPLHVVVSVDDDMIFLVTAYFPSVDIWEADFKTRKVVI
jgi:uncharacterized DUF497 family protein